jgi:hypothetical protein
MIEKINQLKPVDVIRDQYGFWVHPEYQNYWNISFGEGVDFCTDSQWEKLEMNLGIDTKVVELPHMDENDDYDMSLISDQVINNLKPDGEGWFIFSIHECNDGPVAWWAKPKNALPEAVIESLKEVS